MRCLLRVVLATAVLLVSAPVFLGLFGPEAVLRFGESLSQSHWEITLLRVGILGLLLVGICSFRYWKDQTQTNGSIKGTKSRLVSRFLRIGAWLVLLELLFGQEILRRVVEVLAG